MTRGYVLVDEPIRSGPSAAATSPIWPLLAVMLSGGWLAWPWFALNGYAIGSPTRHKELALSVTGALVGGLLLMGAWGALGDELSTRGARYLLLVLNAWQLAVGYVLYTWQSRTFPLFEAFGGEARNGMVVLIVGFLLRPRIIDLCGDSMFLIGVVS